MGRRANSLRMLLPCLALLLLVIPSRLARAAPTFVSILDLGTLDGSWSNAWAVNDLGQATGPAGFPANPGNYRAFRTAPNAPINPTTDNIGTLGGTQNSVGAAINNYGVVAGSASLLNRHDGPFRTAANAPINPAMDNLGTLGQPEGAFGDTDGRGINNIGQVVGSSRDSQNRIRAFRTDPNGVIDPVTGNLGTLGGDESNATGINDIGQVVGDSQTASGSRHAFRTAPNAAINPATDDLGTLGGYYSRAAAINLFGQVAGTSDTASGASHAFLTRQGASAIDPVTDDLGTLPGSTSSYANGMNDRGDVVGGSGMPFLYSGGQMYDLNVLLPGGTGWTLEEARDINNVGQIVGWGLNASGESHAYLLTLVIPEPRALALVAAGGLAVFPRRRQRDVSIARYVTLSGQESIRKDVRCAAGG